MSERDDVRKAVSPRHRQAALPRAAPDGSKEVARSAPRLTTCEAAVVAPMALFTLYRAITGRFAAHKKVARLTLPLWLFVSVSGVLVYFLLYHA
jgi:hypothetical protein